MQLYTKMQLVETHVISKNNQFYQECDRLCFLSKNLYNAALYTIKQKYEETGEYLNYHTINKIFCQTNQIDYRSIPVKCSQQTLMLLDKNYKSYFKLLKIKNKLNGNPQTPKFKHKNNGRNIVIFVFDNISKKIFLKNNLIGLLKTNIKLNSKIDYKNICQVRIVPMSNKQYKIEIVYNKQELPKVTDNNNYCGIDVGLNNLFTVAFNNKDNRNLIVNGRPLKAINQYYNKKQAIIKSELEKCNKKKSSNKLNALNIKRNNKIKDYVHKCTSLLVRELKHNNISKAVIGKNDGWKDEINIGRKNNQNFVSLPHAQAINTLKYKLELQGIAVIIREESYTSKCSAVDFEPIKKQDAYLGKRIKRGLFKSNNGTLINADVNGGANILRKEIPTAFNAYGIEGLVVNPVKLILKY